MIMTSHDTDVATQELLAENPQNPKVCGGMEVRTGSGAGVPGK